MNTYKILSGLRYNGTTYSKGETIEGTAEEFESLVKAGVLKLDDGTEEEVEVTEEAQAPANTWGPQPDVPEVKEVITADNADVVPTTDVPEKKEEEANTQSTGKLEDQSEVKVEETKPVITGDNL